MIEKKSSEVFEDISNLERCEVSSTKTKGSSNKVQSEDLNRALTSRQIRMITLAGIIGTGLFLGGSALADAGPLSMLLVYLIIGLVVFLTMLSLGEMATQFPVSGSFTTYAKRFGSESFGFAMLTNYWLNDAISVASDLTALQLVLAYWTNFPFYVVSLIFWVFLLFLNVIHVKLYGETEYWLSLLKIVTIVIFFIVAIVVNAGGNTLHEYIGFKYWSMGDAPFVNGFKGFAGVFVTAAFAYGGVESVTLTAAEQKNPTRTMPTVIRTVFWRILIFYVFTMFFIGMNVPYNYPNLSTKEAATSPFTIVFQMVGAKGAASFMNAVIMTSVISAGNHALFAGSRLAYNLSIQGYIPKVFTRVNRFKIPYVAVIFTWLCGGLSFGSSFIGAGELWSWLQSIVGLSNLISWWVISVISIRFRRGLARQGRTDELLFKNWTYPYGPWFVSIFVAFVILVQGWSSFSPFSANDFFKSYVELAVFPLTFAIWWVIKKGKDKFVKFEDMDFDSDRYFETEEDKEENAHLDSLRGLQKLKHNLLSSFL
ncbi:uncharacterized protein PRCAT00002494001 [Priceomyces carsonii]|uniref:uncharacterized protein n=1 Tax=Priceomyces carsonii TaxID=28549 RepID=UPI002EDBA9C3|nr:unnamed protein product [Priceomyces carsonii]